MLYKSIRSDNKGVYSDFDFSPYLPHDGQPGEWLPKVDYLSICRSGWHYTDEDNIIEWLNDQIFEVEVRGEEIHDRDKHASQEMRMVRKYEGWNERTARLFACDCAEHVLPIFEKTLPDDKRPRQCIEVARRFANGEATKEELAAAWAAAGDAAWDAARDAAREATWDAARAAGWAAAGAAAGDAARAAGWAAGWDAGWDAERKWQIEKLLELLK